jgi:prolyl oligopeptidase
MSLLLLENSAIGRARARRSVRSRGRPCKPPLAFGAALPHAARMRNWLIASAALRAALFSALACGGSLPSAASSEPAGSGPPSGAAAAESGADAPVAVERPVAHTYHGVTVSDPYEWLEGDGEPVRDWSRAQNAHARQFLDGLPGRGELTARVRELFLASPDWLGPVWKGGRLFVVENRPPKQQPYLVTMPKPDPTLARVLVDPNVLDPSGGTTIDWYVPSEDGKLVAVSLSQGGSESGTVHVYESESGAERTTDVVPRAHGGTAGGSLAWNAEASGFWYTRYPHTGERPKEDLDFYQQVYFHELGKASASDVPSLVEGLPKIAEIKLHRSDDGRWLLAHVANGDGGEFLQFLLDARAREPRWKKLADLDDRVIAGQFARDGSLLLISRNGAPRGKLLRLDPKLGELARAKVVVPESSAVISTFESTATRLYVSDIVGGPSAVRIFDAAGKPHGGLPILPISGVGALARLEGDDVLFRNRSYLDAPAWYRWDAQHGRVSKTDLARQQSAKFDDAEVVRESCASKDGTSVPLSVVRRKGTALDGKNPVLLYGYGGYGISETPRYEPLLRLWLDAGGVYATANLRGGGEFGEEWHRAGNLTNKQHVFDDFIGCAHHLIDAGYTRPEHLAILGGSNGGLLMGAALTQAPELFRAVVAEVGIFDMLRVELTPNGVFNVTEFGTVKDEAQFKALYAYSPYHNVKPGVHYPATLLMTGENDPRVDPFQSRKMVARLQAATPGKTPILLRTSGNTGHGMGTPLDAAILEAVDLWGFLFAELGMPTPGSSPAVGAAAASPAVGAAAASSAAPESAAPSGTGH